MTGERDYIVPKNAEIGKYYRVYRGEGMILHRVDVFAEWNYAKGPEFILHAPGKHYDNTLYVAPCDLFLVEMTEEEAIMELA
jgi:hypothetical protein